MSAFGALVTEFAGVAGVGQLFGLPPALTVLPAAGLLVVLVVSGGYRRVELVGIALGLFELAFVAAAMLAHPSVHALASGIATQPLGQPGYLTLVAANVGAVLMPWMLFYQQSAVVDKGLAARDLRSARIDTALGALLTQLIMVSVLVATAASLHGRAGSLQSVGAIARALAPLLGSSTSRVLLALGILGAALVASIVVSLAAAWAVAEAAGRPRSLNDGLRRAPLFYGLYAGAVALGAVLVLVSHSLVRLAIDVEVVNALLLPLVLGMLILLAHQVLPAAARAAAQPPRRRQLRDDRRRVGRNPLARLRIRAVGKQVPPRFAHPTESPGKRLQSAPQAHVCAATRHRSAPATSRSGRCAPVLVARSELSVR